MAQVKDLKERIKGVQSTQKITKAMKSISLIRLQKAEARALSSRPYIYAVTELAAHMGGESVYSLRNDSKNALFVIFTSDRGLCGAYNDNLLRKAEEAIKVREKTGKIKLVLVGTKAIIHFNRRGYEIHSMYSHLPPDPTTSLSNLVMNDCKKLFLQGDVGEVVLVYNNFKSKLSYEIKIKQLLPLPRYHSTTGSGEIPIYIYEPGMERVINTITEMFLESTVFHSFLDLYASEYSARLTAMSKATDSAQEMLDALTLEMNKTRQAMITTELLEIISGAEALSA
jgi:F-type H+-transporting ATPase subunit gamma